MALNKRQTDTQTEYRYDVVSITSFSHNVHRSFNRESVKELWSYYESQATWLHGPLRPFVSTYAFVVTNIMRGGVRITTRDQS